ncbi:hypothetical protein F2Q69_00020703 [Brassica cretica]|uniref:Uncharacterized protein n=1 Tax=Brassica cretica TaxID=69181 RepID=A0A8S9Q5W6_BRACR|nr:hypothetical protein F2Q69_00020703 [Brassica cretica]
MLRQRNRVRLLYVRRQGGDVFDSSRDTETFGLMARLDILTVHPERFRFRGHDWLYGLANTNTHLPDIFGKLTAVKSTEIEFICTGKVTGIKMDKGWCYVFCSWYRVEMSIPDDTDEGMFVGFDGEMTKLHNMCAYEAGHPMAGEGVNQRIPSHRLLLQTW